LFFNFHIFVDAHSPVANRLIGPGDPLFGSTVVQADNFNSIRVNHGFMNDCGQIGFAYTLTDGREGLALATPIGLSDCDEDGIPDLCEEVCIGDIEPDSGNGIVDIDDYTEVVLSWGTAGPDGDTDCDDDVDIDDFTNVVLNWGDCD